MLPFRAACPSGQWQHRRAQRLQQARGLKRLTVRAAAAAAAVAAGGKAVLVTGSSTGIGRVTAELLASRGFTVFAGVRTSEDAKSLAAASPSIKPLLMDVTSDGSVAAAVKEMAALLGPGSLIGVVNNAGKGTFAPLELMPMDVFEDVLEVNLVGVLRVTKACLPFLKGSEPGRIVNIGSYAGTVALPLFGPYNVSKFGLEALSDVLRYELGDTYGIRTILVKPGGVKTPIWNKSIGASESLASNLPKEGQAQYAGLYKQVFAAAREAEDKGVQAAEVAEVIYEALTAPQPRARYLVGKDASLQMFVRRLLPDWLWDPILMSSLKKLG